MKDFDSYKIWEPTENLPRDLYFGRAHHENGDLVVWLRELGNYGKELMFLFENVVGYRIFPEASRLTAISAVPSFGGFKMSTNSEFLRWYREESMGIFDDWQLVHYLICNVDNVIDVVTGGSVVVKWENIEANN